MKKLFSILLVLILLILPVLAYAEEGTDTSGGTGETALIETQPAEESDTLTGDWYTDYQGVILRMMLSGDGTYTISFSGMNEEPLTGEWKLEDGFLLLDGDETDPLNVQDGMIKWETAGLFFRREAPEVYVPAELLENPAADQYNGYWKTAYVNLNGAVIRSEAVGDDTDVYINGRNVALGGSLFDDIVVAAVFENGVLIWSAEEMTVTLAMQQDGLLRLTVASADAAENPVTLYLLPA